ncbi:hypothetical protein DRO42_02370, partial [Candidatus Bathyarchaeota archaeon]
MTLEVPLRTAALFTLSRHHLLERAPRDQALDVVDDILGLNAQGALNVQLSLWNRVSDLDTAFIPRALHVERSLVKTWVMRNTVHVIPAKEGEPLRRHDVDGVPHHPGRDEAALHVAGPGGEGG